MRKVCSIISAIVLVTASAILAWGGSNKPAPAQSAGEQASDSVADKIFYREAKLIEDMHKFSPLVETYIQNLKPASDGNLDPTSDAYFLGRLVLNQKGLSDKPYTNRNAGVRGTVAERLTAFYRMNYLPLGFMQLVFLNDNFDAQHYELKFVRQQFLGEVRTLVFDVIAKPHFKGPHFAGRIWAEDHDYNIVRINGTYEPRSRLIFYFHFDTWRVNMQPGMWLPAYVYTEETDTRYMLVRKLSMKGQTRLWGYKLTLPGHEDELTAIQVDPAQVSDQSDQPANEFSPIQSERMWEHQAEDNLIERLERAGVLAPEGDVSKVLQTVVNNLEITNALNITPPVRCRVLLTTPFESFTIGHTIIVSRGLLDVLPNEAALASVLAHELAHITLVHRVDTRYAFSNRLLFPDEQVFREVALGRNQREEDEADQKALEFLAKSPYKDKLTDASLFLAALQQHAAELHWLITPHFGNPLASKSEVVRMAGLMKGNEKLDNDSLTQVAALPLGSRVKLDPWDDHLELKKTAAVPLLSAREKMPFEVTPLFPHLVRFSGMPQVAKTAESTAVPK